VQDLVVGAWDNAGTRLWGRQVGGTADRIVLKAASTDDPDEPLAYTIAGVEGRKLKLAGKDTSGELKTFTVEVLGPDLIEMTSPDAAPLRLARVPKDASKP